jgi:hypothetical protein
MFLVYSNNLIFHSCSAASKLICGSGKSKINPYFFFLILQAPRYITSLLDAAKKREIEREMVMQKQIQKQAEVEKELLGDIEQFVTPSYKKKLEEQRIFEEEQRKKEAAELSRTVEGKKDMNAFYRNFVNNVALGGARPDEENNNKETKADTKDKKQSTSGSDLNKKSSSDNRDKFRDDRDKKHRISRSRSRDRKDRRDRSRSRSRSRDKSSRSDSRKHRDDRHRRSRSRSASRSDNDRKRKREEEPKESGKSNQNNTTKDPNNNKGSDNKETNAPVSAEDKAKFARRNDDAAVSSARERYLQRKAQMEAEAAKNAATNNAK